MDGKTDMASVMSMEEMTGSAFLEKLDCQTDTVLSAWVADSEGINGGLPITVADDSYAKGIYKIQPELWLTSQQNITLDVKDGEYSISAECYYNEQPPVVTVEDKGVAEVWYEDSYIKVKPISAGSTHINIHFNETENCISSDYQLNLTVTGAPLYQPGDINGDDKINARDKKLLYNHIAGVTVLSGSELMAADMNADGKINARDKKLLYNHIAGISLLW